MKRITIFGLIILSVCTECKKDGLFSAGRIETCEFPLQSDFSLIEILEMFDITLVQDSVNKALVTCGENLMPAMKIGVLNNTLYLNDNVKYNWTRDYEKIKLELHLKSIPQINIKIPTHITTRDTFKTKNFIIADWSSFSEIDVTLNVNYCWIGMSSNNFGHFTLHGKATDARFDDCGSSFIYARDMMINNCYIKHRSIGDLYINVIDKLTVSIESTGNIYYVSPPASIIIESQTSSGKVIPDTGSSQ